MGLMRAPITLIKSSRAPTVAVGLARLRKHRLARMFVAIEATNRCSVSVCIIWKHKIPKLNFKPPCTIIKAKNHIEKVSTGVDSIWKSESKSQKWTDKGKCFCNFNIETHTTTCTRDRTSAIMHLLAKTDCRRPLCMHAAMCNNILCTIFMITILYTCTLAYYRNVQQRRLCDDEVNDDVVDGNGHRLCKRPTFYA